MREDLPPIYVINLPKDDGRREVMRGRLEKLGLPYEFIEAVNGYELPPEDAAIYDSRRRCLYFGRDLLPGEIGCLLSHYKIYQKMEHEGVQHAVILEDDVIFEEDFEQVLEALMNIDVPWDVIRFLGSEKIYKRGCRKIKPLAGNYSLARLPTTPGGAHGYLLSLDAAKRMIKYMQSSWVPIDTMQGRTWETGLETLVVHPAPLYPEPDNVSTIGDERMDKTVKLSGFDKTMFPLRRGYFKINEMVGKKYVYWSSFFRDRRRNA